MQFKCQRSDLLANLTTIGLAVPTRTAHQVLTNVAIKTDIENNKLTLIGSDLYCTIRSEFECEIGEDGSVTVPYKILKDMIQKLPDGELAIACEDEDEDNPTVTIHSFNGKYQLKGLSYDQYPNTIQELTGETTLDLDVTNLKRGLSHVLPSCAKDEAKQVLTGVNFKVNSNNQLVLASTDGHRLSCITLDKALIIEEEEVLEEPFKELEDNNFDLPEENDEDDGDMGDEELDDNVYDEDEDDIPKMGDDELEVEEDIEIEKKIEKESVQVTIKGEELASLLSILNSHDDEKVTLKYDDKHLSFELRNTLINSRILTGNFPKYEQLIPKEFTGWVCCDRDKFTKGLDQISVLLDMKSNFVKFLMDNDEQTLTLVSTARDLGEAKTIVRCDLNQTMNIGFNYRYLLDAIKVCKKTELKIQFNEPNMPIIISGLGEPDAFTLVMPVQIRD
jgi:DNA polymerase-3 subunit beta